MSERILDGAKLFCNKGSKPSKLKVTSQQVVKIDSKLVATESDKKADVNIPNFGVCSITQKTCKPALINWQDTAPDKINSSKVLHKKSFCPCSIGGKIKSVHPNYNGFAKYK